MSLDLIQADLPVRVHYKMKDGENGHSTIVYLYADGKVLTVSALVLDPSEWTDVEVRKNLHGPVVSPPWAGKTNEELTEHFQSAPSIMGLGKFVPDVHIPISESADEAGIRISQAERMANWKPPIPKTIRRITEKDEVSDEVFLGKEPV